MAAQFNPDLIRTLPIMLNLTDIMENPEKLQPKPKHSNINIISMANWVVLAVAEIILLFFVLFFVTVCIRMIMEKYLGNGREVPPGDIQMESLGDGVPDNNPEFFV